MARTDDRQDFLLTYLERRRKPSGLDPAPQCGVRDADQNENFFAANEPFECLDCLSRWSNAARESPSEWKKDVSQVIRIMLFDTHVTSVSKQWASTQNGVEAPQTMFMHSAQVEQIT